MSEDDKKKRGYGYAKATEAIDNEIQKRIKGGFRVSIEDEPYRINEERLQGLMRNDGIRKLITDALNGRYILDEDAERVTFRYADYLAIIEDIAKIKDDDLKASIIKKLIHGQTKG